MEGWDAVAGQEYVVRLDNAGGLDYISDCSEKRVVALAEVEFHRFLHPEHAYLKNGFGNALDVKMDLAGVIKSTVFDNQTICVG